MSKQISIPLSGLELWFVHAGASTSMPLKTEVELAPHPTYSVASPKGSSSSLTGGNIRGGSTIAEV